MNRRSYKIWLGVACVVGVPSQAAADPACRPAAVLAGDPDLVGELRTELVARDIAATATPGCPNVRAQVVRDEGYIVIDITDAAGRSSRRTVAKAGEAVSLIESWARPDNADLMAGFVVEPPAPPPPPPAPPLAAAAVVARAEPTARRLRDPLSVAITGDVAIDRAAAAWIGTTLDGCIRLGFLCAGGTLQLRRATGADKRNELVGLAMAQVPFEVRGLVLSPGVGVGVGAGTTESNMMTGDQNQTAHVSLRAEARLTLSYPLARRVLVDVTLAAQVSPFADAMQSQDSPASPAEPDLFVQLGAGLRIGAL